MHLMRRHTYRSLFISVLLHALLCFIFFYVALSPQRLPDELKKRIPAQVFFQPQKIVGTPQGTSVGLPPAQPVTQAIKPQAKPTHIKQKPAITKSASTESTNVSVPTTTTSSEASKQVITGAAFMRAFHNAVSSEREEVEQKKAQVYGNMPDHVQNQIEDMQLYTYRQQIYRALNKSARLLRKYVRTSESLFKTIRLFLTIDEMGKLIGGIEKNMSGNAEIDGFITEFLTKAEYPPMPKRLNLKEFHFPIAIYLSFPEGGGMLQLVASQ